MSAGRVGFRTALFAGDARSYRPRQGDPRVESVVPDLVITSLSMLLSCLEGA
jgi:putative hydrolase of the HAD superfamily